MNGILTKLRYGTVETQLDNSNKQKENSEKGTVISSAQKINTYFGSEISTKRPPRQS